MSRFKAGPLNNICDIKGIKVGHVTIDTENNKTGVTAIIPHEGNLFKEKLVCSSHVINGFGKSTGLIQIDELGQLETPIVLTNTLSVGDCYRGLLEYMLEDNEDIGDTTGTVNPVICECNDGYLNDIRSFAVKKEMVREAIENAKGDFEQGDIGAGKGMSCYGLKGGIGSSSRIIEVGNKSYNIGALVLTNFGRIEDLTIAGKKIACEKEGELEEDKGSIIVIIATDCPMSSRQLKRIAKRSSIGIHRTGSFTGNGSGEIAIAFSTANRIKHYEEEKIVNISMMNENHINDFFEATGDIVEEAIVNSLKYAKGVLGYKSHKRVSLEEYLRENNVSL
ncbi:MAG: P1 family peptidase [Firmicutes bacterium]|jgi:D-aminopeptidase|nr:P1 family peptidase [Bacillota bacterium]